MQLQLSLCECERETEKLFEGPVEVTFQLLFSSAHEKNAFALIVHV